MSESNSIRYCLCNKKLFCFQKHTTQKSDKKKTSSINHWAIKKLAKTKQQQKKTKSKTNSKWINNGYILLKFMYWIKFCFFNGFYVVCLSKQSVPKLSFGTFEIAKKKKEVPKQNIFNIQMAIKYTSWKKKSRFK
jgi:hypothetical protein